MKTCPICHARCFDDMETCYGCLHRFSGRESTRECMCEDLANDIAEPILPSVKAASAFRRASAIEREEEGHCRAEPFAGNAACAESEDVFERVTATVRPSRGMHGSMVVRIEIPASILRISPGETGAETLTDPCLGSSGNRKAPRSQGSPLPA